MWMFLLMLLPNKNCIYILFKTASQTAKAASQGQHYLSDGLISMPLGFPYVSSASVFLCTFSP